MTAGEVRFPVAWGELAGLRIAHPGAPKVIALHGWLDNAASFLPLASRLPPLDLLLLDLPGHGRSGHLPAGTEYAATTAIHALLDAADALGWDRFALLGHSMGAGIAALAAVAAPGRVERLALIETLGPLAEEPGQAPARLRDAVAATRALPGKSLRVFADLAAPVRARMLANQLSESSARLLVERGTRPCDGGLVWSSDPRLTLPNAQRMDEARVRALLAAIGCPVQVLFAEPAQAYFPDPVRRARAAALGDGRVHVLAGTHHLHMEQPEQVASLLGPFLAGAAEAGRAAMP